MGIRGAPVWRRVEWLAGRECRILHGGQFPESALPHEHSCSNHLDHRSFSAFQGVLVRKNCSVAIYASVEILLFNFDLSAFEIFQKRLLVPDLTRSPNK